MSKEAEKLAAALDSRVVRNWVHSTGTSPKATGFRHDVECQQAAALLRRQAEQIRELRTALGGMLAGTDEDCGRIQMPSNQAVRSAFATLSNTKEAE